MSDDPRLFALLSEDADDPVPPEHERRIRAALATQLAGSATPSPAPPKTPPAVSSAAAPAWKAVAIGVAGVALAGAGFAAGRATAPVQRASPAPSASLSASPSPSPSAAATAAAGSAPTGASTAPSPSPSVTATATAGSARPGASKLSSPSPSSSFDREQSLLEQARTALVHHDADAAERALATCAREFPKPKHAEELDYLQILVLRERGDEAAVRERARSFLAKYPDGLFKNRVEPLAR